MTSSFETRRGAALLRMRSVPEPTQFISGQTLGMRSGGYSRWKTLASGAASTRRYFRIAWLSSGVIGRSRKERMRPRIVPKPVCASSLAG